MPINPYGWSKLMTERMLADVAFAHPLNYCALRYFNVAGADPEGRSGQSTAGATHLIKIAAEAATGKRGHVSVFGTDFPTRDGTGVRDYIHVVDLALGHQQDVVHLIAHHLAREPARIEQEQRQGAPDAGVEVQHPKRAAVVGRSPIVGRPMARASSTTSCGSAASPGSRSMSATTATVARPADVEQAIARVR